MRMHLHYYYKCQEAGDVPWPNPPTLLIAVVIVVQVIVVRIDDPDPSTASR
jgi:hypothetical protein